MEHPDITRTIETGYPHGEPNYPHCPVCGSECEEIYFNEDKEIFGCDECVRTKSAWFVRECFSGGEYI